MADLETWSSRETTYPGSADCLAGEADQDLWWVPGRGCRLLHPVLPGDHSPGYPFISAAGANLLPFADTGKERLLVKTDGQHAAYTGSAKAPHRGISAGGRHRQVVVRVRRLPDQQSGIQFYECVPGYRVHPRVVPGNVEFFFGPEGTFIAQIHGGTQDPELYVRDSRNLLYLSRFTSAR